MVEKGHADQPEGGRRIYLYLNLYSDQTAVRAQTLHSELGPAVMAKPVPLTVELREILAV